MHSRHGGKLPAEHHALLRLPGVGRYTAGAVMSIAFGKPWAATDGNVRRVYARLLGRNDPGAAEEAAERMVSRSRPGDFNQAVMELGATLCLPSAPECPRCPLAHWCQARATGSFDFPRRRPVRTRAVEWPMVLVEWRSRILLHRRPEGGILAGLWELPGPAALPAEAAETTPGGSEPVAVVRHAITDRRITAPVYVLRQKVRVNGPSWRWVRAAEIPSCPLSSLSAKAIRAARRHLRAS